MGKAIKKAAGFTGVGALLGLGKGDSSGKGAGDPNMSFFDIGKEVKPFKQMQDELLQQQLEQTRAVAPQQSEVMQAMGEAALGRGPSLAEAQLKAAQDRTLAQQLAAAQAARGGSAAANQRALIKSQSDMGRELAQGAAQERLAERDRFMQASQNQGAQTRQDLGSALDISLAPKREKQQAELARAQADLTRTQGRKDRQGSMLGSILGAGAAALAMPSDEKMKKNKKAADKEVSDFLDKLEAKSFEYKEPDKPGRSPGKKYGIMAQALEKSEMGKSLVRETPDGKMVDIADGFGAVLASQAELNKRLKKLEGDK